MFPRGLNRCITDTFLQKGLFREQKSHAAKTEQTAVFWQSTY
jgi:hypothetical protein